MRYRTSLTRLRPPQLTQSVDTIPKDPKSSVYSVEEEAIIVAIRLHVLPLDDCLYALRPTHT